MITPTKWDGKKITKPGIYSGIPIETYHGDICDGPSVSSSGLRKIVNDSPADYWDGCYMNPDADPFEESAALLMGRAVHHLILGEKNFAASFVIQPDTYVHEKDGVKPWSNNAKVCKTWRAEQKEAGRSVLTKGDVETIRGMAKSLARDELVNAGILNGLVEHSIFWKDRLTGIWVKSRPDTIPTHSGDVADLKTIMGVDYQDCVRSIDDNGYYQQAGLVRQGLREVLGIEVSTFTFMFAAKKRPFSTRPMILHDDDMALGDQANRVGLDVMARCLREKVWPGPGRGPGRDIAEYVRLSDFARERVEHRLMRLKDTFELNRK
jgi:hypothetical protein